MGRDTLDPSAGLDAHVGPDAGIRRLLRLHSHKKRRTELASCKAGRLLSITKTRRKLTKPIQRRTSQSTCSSVNSVRVKVAHAVRPPSNTEKSEEQRETEKKERGRDKPSNCDASNDARRAERPGQRSTGLQHRPTTMCLPPFFLETSESPASLSLATVNNGSSSSHEKEEGTTRWKHGWSRSWEGSGDTRAASRAGLRRARDDCLHMKQEHLQQTTVRRPQKTLSEQAASRTKGIATCEATEVATQAREQQEEARLAYDQKCQDSAEAETTANDAIKNTFKKKEALEKHVKTVTTSGILGEHGGRFLQNTS